jgi:hypothetical protein
MLMWSLGSKKKKELIEKRDDKQRELEQVKTSTTFITLEI